MAGDARRRRRASLPRGGKAKQRNLADAKTHPHAGDINEAAARREALRLSLQGVPNFSPTPYRVAQARATRAVKKSAQPPRRLGAGSMLWIWRRPGTEPMCASRAGNPV